MIKKIFSVFLNRKTFFRGSAILAFTAILSNLTGLLRDRIFAHVFGASSTMDAFNAAFTIPNLLLNIFVAGALTAAFVPIFSGLLEKKEKKETSEFANSVLNSSVLVVLITGILVFIFAPQLSKLIVPGFTTEYKTLFVGLMRLLVLSPIIFAISNTIGSILISDEKFFWYGMSAVAYNIGIICGGLFLTAKYGIYGAVIGTLAGAILHLIFRLIGVGKHYFTYKPEIKFDYNFKRYLRLMIPKMIGQPIDQLTFLGFTIIGSTIAAGAIVELNYANNFQTVPLSILGITFAMIAFPILSKMAARNEKKEFVAETIFTAKAIVLTTLPVAAFMFIFQRPIISILIGGGAFDKNAIALTAATMGAFTPSIVTESVNQLLSRAFYALKNSLTPTLISLGGLAITLISAYIFAIKLSFGVPGLALGFFLGSVFKLIFHILLLKKQTKKAFVQENAFVVDLEQTNKIEV
jgi:putative peptidoglycan lipid II flippase